MFRQPEPIHLPGHLRTEIPLPSLPGFFLQVRNVTKPSRRFQVVLTDGRSWDRLGTWTRLEVARTQAKAAARILAARAA